MAGLPHASAREDNHKSSFTNTPPALPRHVSMNRTRGASLTSGAVHGLATQPSLQRIHSNQVNGSYIIPRSDSARRPSLGPDNHGQYSSQISNHSILVRTDTGSTVQSHFIESSQNSTPEINGRTTAPIGHPFVDLGTRTTVRHETLDRGLSTRQPQRPVPTRVDTQIAIADGTTLAPHAPTGSLQSIGEFAQQHLFSQFRVQADAKITRYTSPQYDQVELHINREFGPGADPKFDQLLQAIGHSARRDPTSFLDKVTVWHDEVIDNPSVPMQNKRHPNVYHERRTSLAIYLLCRALLEILGQPSTDPLERRELDRVETLVYERRFRTLCKEKANRTPAAQAKWDMLSQVIGGLFDVDFARMADRVIADLNTFQHTLGVKGSSNSPIEDEATTFLKGLRTVKLKSETEFEWSGSCTFLDRVTHLFNGVHGEQAKKAYCRFIGDIILPVAQSPKNFFLQALAWKKLVTSLSQRLAQLESKPKYWPVAFPVQAILACVSPHDFFDTRFRAALSNLSTRLREHKNRAYAIKAICRLVWTYLDRNADNPDLPASTAEGTYRTTETINEVIKVVFFSGKRYSLSKEPAIAEPLVQLIRIIGHKHQHLCFKSIIFPLLNSEVLRSTSPKDLRIDQLDPDKCIIGIRACLRVIDDLESGIQPPFPIRFDDETFQDARASLADFSGRRRQTSMTAKDLSGFDRFSAPVAIDSLSPSARDFFRQFCELVNKVVLVCDAGFGGLAAIDDRYTSAAVPKTPLTGSFNRRDDASNLNDERATFFELLNLGICALPRCLVHRLDKNAIVTCLCNGTAHTEQEIASSSMHALKSIAKQGHAQLIIDRFLGFILNYDNRCSIGGGLNLSLPHIEHTLQLYVELLGLWINDLYKSPPTDVATPTQLTETKSETTAISLEGSAVLEQVDRVESQALFFLCSPSPRIRTCAKAILVLVTKLDAALGKSNIRVNSLLETEPTLSDIIKVKDQLPVYQKSILLRERNPLNSLICGLVDDHKTLWYEVFPHLVEVVNKHCLMAVTQTRQDVCTRLSQMQGILESHDETFRAQHQAGSIDLTIARSGRYQAPSLSEALVDQWKAYLIFACKTLTQTGKHVQDTHQEITHTRKSSKSSQSTQGSISTSTDLFVKVIPFLNAQSMLLRQATVMGLGSVSSGLIRSLLEAIDYLCERNGHARVVTNTHSRTASSPRRQASGGFSIEIAHIYDLVSRYLVEDEVRQERWILKYFSAYTKDLSTWLHSEDGINAPTELRTHFCNIVENLWNAVKQSEEQREDILSFYTRRSAFTNMERWTGLPGLGGSDASQHQLPQGQHHRGNDDRSASNPLALKERDTLSRTAMNAMAALCDGPRSMKPPQGYSTNSFDLDRLMRWVHSMFEKDSDSVNLIGRRALTNIVENHANERIPIQRMITRLYDARSTRCLNNYLTVVAAVTKDLLERDTLEHPTLLTALLFTLSSSDGHIRTTSARLLRNLDERREAAKGTSCKLQNFEMSISDRTPAVYKKAQFDITSRLAEAFAYCADDVFAEFALNFHRLRHNAEDQRSFVHAILPWLKNLDLQLQESLEVTSTAYMVLMNLLEITFNYSAPLQHEVQALWQTLVAGPHRGNVRLILEFTMNLTLVKRNPRLVEVVRQIIVFLSDTTAGERLIDALLQQIVPWKMVYDSEKEAQRIQNSHPPEVGKRYTYIGEIPLQQTDLQHPWEMTAGHLSLILLVDLIVAPRKVPLKNIPPILQAVLVLWDHRIPIVQEQAREMLVHLIHELVISDLDNAGAVPDSIERFVDLVRRRDKQVLWGYQDNDRFEKGYELTAPFKLVVSELIKTFSHIYPGIDKEWGSVTLQWVLGCQTLHLAMRSLQVYRCILLPMDPRIVAGLVRVLSTLVADNDPEKKNFAIEALRTVRAVLQNVDPTDMKMFTQLFWAVSAWLGVGRETEFEEGLVLLDIILERFDLNNLSLVSNLLDTKPAEMAWEAGGLTTLILPGCRSYKHLITTLKTLDRLMRLPSNEIVGTEERFLYVLLANMPRFRRLHIDHGSQDGHALAAAGTLATAASKMGYDDLAIDLNSLFSGDRPIDSIRVFEHIKKIFFPTYEYSSLVFLMGLLTNNYDSMQRDTLATLDVLTNNIDMTNTQISLVGPALVQPLLRLLQTDLTELALRVLDKFSAIMSKVNGKTQLKMSMTTPRASQALRNEFDGPETIFGIPEETGWSVANLNQLKVTTQANLSLISNMYTDTSADPAALIPTPEIEFRREPSNHGSYFSSRATMVTSEGADLTETSMGELVTKLDGLDEFFDEDDGDADTLTNSFTLARSPSDLTPTGYQNTIRGSFDSFSGSTATESFRTASLYSRSFQGSVPSRGTPLSPREPVMSPSAFNAIVTPHKMRPGMPDRSVTEPGGTQNQLTPPDKTLTASHDEIEPFSDDDAMVSGTASDASSFADGSDRPLQRSRPSFRAAASTRLSSISRKIAEGASRSRARQLHMKDSPEVPKVPDYYYRGSDA